MTLTKYGFREWGSATLVLILLEITAFILIRYGHPGYGIGIAAASLVLWLAFVAFFRNPVRHIPADPTLIVSPADGTVRDIGIVEDFDLAPFKGKALRIGIFLSVFNVHVNRTPAQFSVTGKFYREGEYLDARDSECSKRNEAMTLTGTGKIGDAEFNLAVRQISGAIARRIVCPVDPGQKFKRGELYGMIKFGSRTELYLPAEGFEVLVKPGDKVRAGESALARLTDAGKAQGLN